MICTFFGHRDVPAELENKLFYVLKDLIENKGVDMFYVGNHGGFDIMVRKNLRKLSDIYPNIKYYVVLAYMPTKTDGYEDYSDTIYPDGVENIPPKFAVIKRNEWMIKRSDCVVTYVKNEFGGAAKFKSLANKWGKKIYELSET